MAALFGGYVVWLHQQTGVWSLDPNASAHDTITFNDRTYVEFQPIVRPDGAVKCESQTIADVHVTIYVTTFDTCTSIPTLIHVDVGGEWLGYGLVGGP